MYTLQKIEIKPDCKSDVKVGQRATSKELRVIRSFDKSDLRDDDVVNGEFVCRVVKSEEIEAGDEVVVFSNWANFIKTSPVVCKCKTPDGIILETKTSFYKLTWEDKK